jgi:Concanavalin A-like lectin/glucanases superfamily
MKKLVVFPVLTLLWVACSSDQLTFPSGSAGGGGASGSAGQGGTGVTASGSGNAVSGATSAGTSSGGAATAGSASGGGGGGGKAGAAGSGGTAGGGAGSGGTAGAGGTGGTAGTAGTAGTGGVGYPQPTTCSGYAAKFGEIAAFASVTRVVQNDFTLEAWVKTSATSLTGVNFYEGNGLIYADIAGDANDFGLSILNNKLAFGTGQPDTTLAGATAINTGNWVHVAATRDATSGAIEVLLFGVSDGQVTTTNHNPLNAATTITFGANAVDGRYFSGLMDEVKIWNYVRTPAEIKAGLHHKLHGDETGLVGYWSLDDAGKLTSPDASVSKADATINGAVDWVDAQAPVCDPIPDSNAGGAGGAGGEGGGM